MYFTSNEYPLGRASFLCFNLKTYATKSSTTLPGTCGGTDPYKAAHRDRFRPVDDVLFDVKGNGGFGKLDSLENTKSELLVH